MSVTTFVSRLIWGIVEAIVLFITGAGFWMIMVHDIELDRQSARGFAFFHLVYGSVLGAWVGLRFRGRCPVFRRENRRFSTSITLDYCQTEPVVHRGEIQNEYRSTSYQSDFGENYCL